MIARSSWVLRGKGAGESRVPRECRRAGGLLVVRHLLQFPAGCLGSPKPLKGVTGLPGICGVRRGRCVVMVCAGQLDVGSLDVAGTDTPAFAPPALWIVLREGACHLAYALWSC
eukprot:4513889-Alexandrium_andersonii.AAC.1